MPTCCASSLGIASTLLTDQGFLESCQYHQNHQAKFRFALACMSTELRVQHIGCGSLIQGVDRRRSFCLCASKNMVMVALTILSGLQFSSRDYKHKEASNAALRIPTWASQDPSKVVFPPSYRQQLDKRNGRKPTSRSEKSSEGEPHRRKEDPTAHKRRRSTDEERDYRRNRLPSQPLYRPSTRRRSDGPTEEPRRGSHTSASPPPPPPLPPGFDDSRYIPAPYNPQSPRSHLSHGGYNDIPGNGHHNGYMRGETHGGSRLPSSRRTSCPPRHQSSSRSKDRPQHVPHNGTRQCSPHAPSPPPKPDKKDDAQKDTLDLFISAGFGQGFAAAPKVLGDLFEAIIGAVYIDSGGDLEALWKVRTSTNWLKQCLTSYHFSIIQSHCVAFPKSTAV